MNLLFLTCLFIYVHASDYHVFQEHVHHVSFHERHPVDAKLPSPLFLIVLTVLVTFLIIAIVYWCQELFCEADVIDEQKLKNGAGKGLNSDSVKVVMPVLHPQTMPTYSSSRSNSQPTVFVYKRPKIQRKRTFPGVVMKKVCSTKPPQTSSKLPLYLMNCDQTPRQTTTLSNVFGLNRTEVDQFDPTDFSNLSVVVETSDHESEVEFLAPNNSYPIVCEPDFEQIYLDDKNASMAFVP